MGILVNDIQIGGGGTTSYTDLLEFLYPIGSLYIGTQETCPLELAGIGTWVKLSSGRVLQISDDSHTADTTVEAGLPNITGTYRAIHSNGGEIGFATNLSRGTGAFYPENIGAASWVSPIGTGGCARLAIDASRSNSIYGNSDTVQPSAYIVNVWRRTS